MPHSAAFGKTSSITQNASSTVPLSANRVFNLTFHGLGMPGSSIVADEKRYWLDVDAFERILDHVSQWPNTRITFDDGNLSDLIVAVPRLLEHHLRGSFFIVAARMGREGYMGRSELLELLAAGMEIGSHGMHHHSWRRTRGGDLLQEIRTAKAILEDTLGVSITQAACPFGDYDRTALNMLANSGFTRVYTSDRGWARPNAWIQARNTVAATTDIRDVEQVRSWPWSKNFRHYLKLTLKRYR
jgi:peptidoglycan/xylan/chitin deacetylase (PgdA/CDA1 family)